MLKEPSEFQNFKKQCLQLCSQFSEIILWDKEQQLCMEGSVATERVSGGGKCGRDAAFV